VQAHPRAKIPRKTDYPLPIAALPLSYVAPRGRYRGVFRL
jgi:hypothetical protein